MCIRDRMSVVINSSGVASGVLKVKLYQDTGDELFNTANDVLIGSVAFTGGGLANISIPSPVAITAKKTFYVAFDIADGTTPGSMIGAQILNYGKFTMDPNFYQIGANGLPAGPSTTTVVGAKRVVMVTSQSSPAAADVTQGNSVDMLQPVSYTHLTLPTKRIV